MELSTIRSYGAILNSQFLPVYTMANPVNNGNNSRVYLYYDSTRYGSVLYISDAKVQIICNTSGSIQVYVYGIK